MTDSYKCPGCGAPLVYEEGKDSLVCPYCGTSVAIADVKKEARTGADQAEVNRRAQADAGAAKKIRAGNASAGTGGAEADTAHFQCTSCGGELLTDIYTAATVCPFCGSPSIIQERLSGEGKPDVLIPFSIDKKKAKELFRKWTRRGFFTPRGFSRASTLDRVTGLYVPYWLYHYDTQVHMDAQATRIRTRRQKDMEYTDTDHFLVTRTSEVGFERIPADASRQMPDDTMERLEPFDYQGIREFDMPYLSGYLAERTNFSPEELEPRARERAGEFAVQATRETMQSYSTVIVTDSRVDHRLKKKEYAMLPVWVLNYRYRGKDWKLYLNGQTGREIGSLPIDKLRVALCYGISSAVITLLAALIWGVVL